EMKKLMQDQLRQMGMPEDYVQNIDISKLIEQNEVWSECNLNKYQHGAESDGQRPGTKSYCCERLVALDCVFGKSNNSMAMATSVDTVHCDSYLLFPFECDLHIR